MQIRGRVIDRSPADLLEWIEEEGRTGVLRFYDPAKKVRKDIWFEDGAVISSGSNLPREWLGQFLIAKGKITEEDFVRAYRTQVETRVLFGKVLAMIGLADEAEVEQALQEKTEEAILDVFLWTTGYFEFEDAPHPFPDQRLGVTIDVPSLIEHGETRQIEWGVIRQVLPSSHAVPVLDPGKVQGASGVLDGREKRMLSLARNKRTLKEIALDLHLPEFRVLKKFHEWVQKGLVLGVTDAPVEIAAVDLEELPLDDPLPAIQLPTPKEGVDASGARASLADKIPVLLRPIEELTEVSLTAEEGYILSRVDGTFDVESILLVCPFQEDLALEALGRLVEQEIVSLEHR